MRLIDADKLKSKFQNLYDFYCEAYGGFQNMEPKDKARADEIMNSIAEVVNSETIKAIPIEWIWGFVNENAKDFWAYVTDFADDVAVKEFFISMIKTWNKVNEQR